MSPKVPFRVFPEKNLEKYLFIQWDFLYIRFKIFLSSSWCIAIKNACTVVNEFTGITHIEGYLFAKDNFIIHCHEL